MRGIFVLSACHSALWKGSLAFSESGRISSECFSSSSGLLMSSAASDFQESTLVYSA